VPERIIPADYLHRLQPVQHSAYVLASPVDAVVKNCLAGASKEKALREMNVLHRRVYETFQTGSLMHFIGHEAVVLLLVLCQCLLDYYEREVPPASDQMQRNFDHPIQIS
jgi:hypothetical protein